MSRIPQTRDAQALQFGINSATGSGVKAPQKAGTLSAVASGPPPTATTDYDNTGTAANDLTGQIIITTTTSATWASANVVYGTILSNTQASGSVVTVDGWWKISDNTSAGANPFATALYVILPCAAPYWIVGITDSVSAVAGTETGTAPGGTEYTANGLGRTIATTLTHTAGASTGTIGVTFTYTGSSSVTIGRSFVSNSKTASAGSGRGNFGFFIDQLNGASGYVVASNGDTLQITYTVTYATVP